jgi:hypothetical protein
MAKVLFIGEADLKRHTIVDGSVDADNFIHYISIAQDIHIQNYLGTQLYEKLQSLIEDGTIGDEEYVNYRALWQTHVKPMLIHWAMVDYLPFAAFTLSNKGIYRSTSGDATLAEKEDVDYLVSKERNIADYYTTRFVEYMRHHDNLFPEYNTHTDDDVYPSSNSSFNGLYLDY